MVRLFSRSHLRFVIGLLLGAIVWASPTAIRAQQQKQAILDKVGEEYAIQQQQAEVRILEYLKKNPQARYSIRQNGAAQLLVDVTASGVPVYIQTLNNQVATTLGVIQLRTGGSLGINILGTGMKIATWDAGRVREDHVELVGRVTQVDGAIGFSDHATHTAGTMIASGVNPAAKGMAPAATLSAFDYTNDTGEMSVQAKPDQTSLLLSNHSYGTVAGWDCSSSPCVWRGDPSIDPVKDYKFGFYTAEANQWDNIALGAPYYLIVKAAGNDRNEYNGTGPQSPDGPFDCIPTSANAKNIMTVGAVNKTTYTGPSSVVLAGFSSCGPTDDGRIKPDIVAPGVDVLSSVASSTSAYAVEQGTSMSTPAVTGSLTLLQQLYKSLNSGNYMRSATLKALAIHTAHECGSAPGPDYQFGWGLLDVEGAARTILNKDNQNIYMLESVLTNGQAYELNLTPNGTANTKITATLVWTDPAGTPPSPALNPSTLMLKNDLDMRLIDDNNTTQFPWTLNPANPSAAATRASDNLRDNVEKIEFDNPQPRNYKVRITNKGTLVGGSQAFSLIVTYSSVVDPLISYYWIGTSGGAWNNGANWSLTSGGSPVNQVPTANDRVVFDEKSFTGNSTITLTANQSCYSLRWFGNQYNVDFSLGGNTLSIAENMTLLTNKITTSTAGTINFNSSLTATNSVDLNANNLDKWSLLFAGNSSWSVTGSASVDKITVGQGTMTLTGTALHLNQLVPTGAASKTIGFSNASIQALTGLVVDFTGVTVQSDQASSIVISPSVTNAITLSSANYQGIVSVQGGDVAITGTGTVRSIQGNGIVRLNGGMLVSNINLSGGSQLILQQGATHTFTDKMVFATSAASHVAIKSSGSGKATLAFNGYYKVCLDFVDVTNVDVSGPSIVSAGAGGTVTNSLNWLQASCSTILFPDFAISYACVQSSTYFTDQSSGPITTRQWNFGDPSSAQNTSTLANPLHYYTTAGPFTATLTVNGSSGSRSTSKVVTLLPNTLPDNTIQINNGSMISTVIASSYQWLKDGQLIPGATSRSYNFSGTTGEYSVLIFNSTCNKRSAPFIVTGFGESQATKTSTVKIYPNPTSDFLQIESAAGIQSASILDAVGREWKVELEKMSDDRSRANVSVVPAGLYILKVVTKERTELQKVIIRK
jgi:PKD repeat protein